MANNLALLCSLISYSLGIFQCISYVYCDTLHIKCYTYNSVVCFDFIPCAYCVFFSDFFF